MPQCPWVGLLTGDAQSNALVITEDPPSSQCKSYQVLAIGCPNFTSAEGAKSPKNNNDCRGLSASKKKNKKTSLGKPVLHKSFVWARTTQTVLMRSSPTHPCHQVRKLHNSTGAAHKAWWDNHISLSLPNAKATVMQWQKQNVVFMGDWMTSWQRLLFVTSFWSTLYEISAPSPLSWLTELPLTQAQLGHPTMLLSKELGRPWNFVLLLSSLWAKCSRKVFLSLLPFSQLLHSGQHLLYGHKWYTSHTVAVSQCAR